MKLTTVFIQGIAKRSGTNFLHQALLLHPQVTDAAHVFKEDWFVTESDGLESFVTSIWKHWKYPPWGISEEIQQELYSYLGNGLQLFLQNSAGASIKTPYVVTKTPSLRNLSRFQKLFPQSKQIILVRDPRDVAVSAFRTWEKPLQNSLDEWDNALEILADYELKYDNYLLIRYEDLLLKYKIVLENVFDYLGLESAQFPWQEFEKLGIFGSSEKGWGCQDKTSDFNPVGRWENLDEAEKSILLQPRLTWQYLGYGQEKSKLPPMEERQKLFVSEKLPEYEKQKTSKVSSTRTGLRKRLKWLSFALLGEQQTISLIDSLKKVDAR